MSEEPELLLYTTAGCHLCEQAEHILRTQLTGFRLTLVDVAESDALVADYGIRIPVIALRGVDADLGWPFSAVDVADYLQRHCS